jgi:RIO kinase 1
MARAVSRRKKPLKEDYQLKERFKIESEVFDRGTLMILQKLMKKGMIETVDYPISTGKEANVFRASTESGVFVALKVYKVETSPFLRKMEYMVGDPRFEHMKHSERDIVAAFARKEFKNLQLCQEAGVHAPKPHFLLGRVIIMGFLGVEGLPYPTLEVLGSIEPEKELASILDDIRKMYRAGLVHADISEYNILLGDHPYLIDFGQGVVLSHPKAKKFLERDVANILKYYKKRGVEKDLEKTLSWIRGE